MWITLFKDEVEKIALPKPSGITHHYKAHVSANSDSTAHEGNTRYQKLSGKNWKVTTKSKNGKRGTEKGISNKAGSKAFNRISKARAEGKGTTKTGSEKIAYVTGQQFKGSPHQSMRDNSKAYKAYSEIKSVEPSTPWGSALGVGGGIGLAAGAALFGPNRFGMALGSGLGIATGAASKIIDDNLIERAKAVAQASNTTDVKLEALRHMMEQYR